LATCQKKCVVFVEANGKEIAESNLEAARCEIRDREQGVGSVIDNCNFAY
jgi:hypothetical protein